MAEHQKKLYCSICGQNPYDVDKEVKSVVCCDCIMKRHKIYCDKVIKQIAEQKARGIILDKLEK